MKKKEANAQWTLVKALENIWRSAHGSNLHNKLLKEIKEPADYVNEKFGVNPFQAVIIAILADAGGAQSTREISNFLGCSNITLLSHNDDLSDLCRRRMIYRCSCRSHGQDLDGFMIYKNTMDCIKDDSDFKPEDMTKFTHWKFLRRVDEWMRITDSNTENYGHMLEDIKDLVADTQHLKLSKFLADSVNQGKMTQDEMVFFLLVCCFQIIRRMSCVGTIQYEDIMFESYVCADITSELNDGCNNLSKLHLLENDCTEGIVDRDDFRLTQEACKGLLSDYHVSYSGDVNMNTETLIKPEDIASKKLYFNPEEGRQIERLRDLLSPEKFTDVQKRLKESGLRSGFCVLMHGVPGSGKTESVYQLCKESGHPIYQVNVSELKSKWVGDSEKQVQGMFLHYNELVKEAKKQNTPVPVLFLNEADAIMGRRMTGESADSSVGKMENAIQNIILQGMETLEGILIATTNLTDNLDNAMTRRWIFTIRYDTPSTEVKSKIFQSMIPQLSVGDAKSLADEFPDFCGGQCENVTRRLKVEHVLYNTPFSVDRVRQLCKEEGIKKSEVRKSIGFH